MSSTLVLVLLCICSYFLGNVNWAIIISKSKKNDIRKMGSGNPGTLNMSRNFGLKFGLLTFFLDIMKGAIPTFVAFMVFRGRTFENSTFIISDMAIYLCGLCAVLGHIYPAALGFKGGKGIASTIGVLIITETTHGWQWSLVLLMALIVAVLFIYFTEFGAMGSFLAITPPAVSGAIRLFLLYGTKETLDKSNFGYYIATNCLIVLLCFFTWLAHRKNIKRMLAGEEHPTSIKEMVVKMKAKKLASKEEENKKA